MKYLVNEEIFQNVIRSAEELDSALGELSQIPLDDIKTGYYLHLQRVRREVIMLKSFLEAHVEVCPSTPRVAPVRDGWAANFLWLEALCPVERVPTPSESASSHSIVYAVA